MAVVVPPISSTTMSIAGVGDDAPRVVDHLRARRRRCCEHAQDRGRPPPRSRIARPGAALDFFLVALQHLERAAADRADAQQTDLDRFHLALLMSVVLEEALDAANGFRQVVGVGQEHEAKVIRPSAS